MIGPARKTSMSPMAGDSGSILSNLAARGFPLPPVVLPEGVGAEAVGATVVVTGEVPSPGLLARSGLVLADDAFDRFVVVLRGLVDRGLSGHHRLHRGDDLVGDLRVLRVRRPVDRDGDEVGEELRALRGALVRGVGGDV